MASRPLVTDSVIDVPLANDADPVLPTFTLMPDGVDSTVSPPRPCATTVSVDVPAGGGADWGVTVRPAVLVAPPNVPAIVTVVDALTLAVVTPKVALVAPAATVTLAGTVATAVLLRSEEHTSELQSLTNLVCRLLLEKKKKRYKKSIQSKGRNDN